MSKNVILSNGERENPSPLIYDKHKKHCIFRTKTLLSEEKKKTKNVLYQLYLLIMRVYKKCWNYKTHSP